MLTSWSSNADIFYASACVDGRYDIRMENEDLINGLVSFSFSSRFPIAGIEQKEVIFINATHKRSQRPR